MKITRVRTFYQADPVGTVPGGIDTFFRGLVKYAPDDLSFSLVGMTTEPERRPVGRWTRCSVGRREFAFFPAFAERNAGGRSRIPLTLRLSWHAWRARAQTLAGFDVVELHRVEPLLLFLNYFLVAPRHTFTIAEPDSAVTIVVLLLVAVAVAAVVDGSIKRAREASQAAREAELLALFAGSVLRGADLETLLERVR